MSTLFDSDFLKKLEYLSLVSKRVFQGQLFAQRRTTVRGGGVEFADYRNYFPGDDLRYLDWNVYARYDNLLIKRFEEEEDLHLYFLVDASRSMATGNPAKFDYARLLTAALAYIALADMDRVSIMTFDNRICDEFPLTRGKENILSVLRFLEQCEVSSRPTSLESSFRQFVHRKQRHGLAVVLSDFFDPAGYQQGLDLLRYSHYDPIPIQIHDSEEADPKYRGELRLFDIERSEGFGVTVSESVLALYKKKFTAFLDGLIRYALLHDMGCTVTPTAIPFDELILRMMRESSVLR